MCGIAPYPSIVRPLKEFTAEVLLLEALLKRRDRDGNIVMDR